MIGMAALTIPRHPPRTHQVRHPAPTVCCAAALGATTPTSAAGRGVASTRPSAPTAASVSGPRGLRNFIYPSSIFPLLSFLCIFRPPTPSAVIPTPIKKFFSMNSTHPPSEPAAVILALDLLKWINPQGLEIPAQSSPHPSRPKRVFYALTARIPPEPRHRSQPASAAQIPQT